MIELHFSRLPFSRTSRTSLFRTVCRVLRALSRNWILPHNIDKCLFGRFCVLRRTKRLAPLRLNYFDIHHSPSAGTVQYNYITQKVVNEGVSEELHAEKIINFWCPLNFLCPINNILYGKPAAVSQSHGKIIPATH